MANTSKKKSVITRMLGKRSNELLNWDEQADQILENIKTHRSFLKIVLKTFNDPFLLEKWIKHHARIVGLENLVVADNMSDDPDVLGVYKRYAGKLLVFQFAGFHNRLHDRTYFKPLYDALHSSSEYALFLDTDELLIWLEADRWYADEYVVERIQSLGSKLSLPATWLHNVISSDEYFHIGTSIQRLCGDLKWGKPLVSELIHSSSNDPMMIHNAQFPTQAFNNPICPHIFLMHLTQLFPEQRIKVNVNKLIARNFASSTDSLEDILAKDLKNVKDPTVVRFITEIKDMLAAQDSPAILHDKIPNGCIHLAKDGQLKFASAKEEAVLKTFLTEGKNFSRLAFDLFDSKKDEETAKNSLDTAFLNLLSANDLRMEALSRKENKDYQGAERAFLHGMELFPEELDQYRHPTFRKELVRMLLNQQEWNRAKALIPSKGGIEYSDWHERLFARANAQAGDDQSAMIWWDRVIEHNPEDVEAKEWLMKNAQKLLDPQSTNNGIRIWNVEDISSRPAMEKEGVDLLEEHLRNIDTFLEFGAGGSTVFAAELGVKNIYSVESDKSFLDAVEKKVASRFPSSKVYAHFIDIGETKEWGYPNNKRRMTFWPKYCIAPWQAMLENNQSPDLVLIDGRFRVACFLASLLLSKPGTVILFDDYFGRPEYHIVEKHLRSNKTAGRMAKFIINPNLSTSQILIDLMSYATDLR